MGAGRDMTETETELRLCPRSVGWGSVHSTSRLMVSGGGTCLESGNNRSISSPLLPPLESHSGAVLKFGPWHGMAWPAREGRAVLVVASPGVDRSVKLLKLPAPFYM